MRSSTRVWPPSYLSAGDVGLMVEVCGPDPGVDDAVVNLGGPFHQVLNGGAPSLVNDPGHDRLEGRARRVHGDAVHGRGFLSVSKTCEWLGVRGGG